MIKQLSNEKLKQMSKQELCNYCRAHKIKGYSGKNKAQRVDLIISYYEDKSLPESTKKPIEKQEIPDKPKIIKPKIIKPKISKERIAEIKNAGMYWCNKCDRIHVKGRGKSFLKHMGEARIVSERESRNLQFKANWDRCAKEAAKYGAVGLPKREKKRSHKY